MQNIGQQSIRNLWIPIPPLREQAAIAKFLDEEVSIINQTIVKIGAAIERLQEYRATLITAAVTGKIDVRSLIPRLTPDPSPRSGEGRRAA